MALSGEDRLRLILVKVNWAKKHLRDLETELAAFRGEHVNVVIGEANLGFRQLSGEIISDVHRFPKLPFAAICASGDIVHNLRASLDHLANHLVWVGSGAVPSRRVEFPIAESEAAYAKAKAGKVEGMCPGAIIAIDALKPYKGGNDDLWRLHGLNNIDKHRTLFTIGTDGIFVADWLPPSGIYLQASDPEFSGVFDEEVEQNLKSELGKAVGYSEIAKGDALLPTLVQLVEMVDSIILKFKPFL